MALPGSSPPIPPDSVAEIEKRIRWPALPALLFLGILLGLGVVALIGTRREPPFLTGLPDDPDSYAAIESVRGLVGLDLGPLRFRSALFGEVLPVAVSIAGAESSPAVSAWISRPPSMDGSARLARATELLARVEDRHPKDVRVIAALASLDLARGALERAEHRYRIVVEKSPGYGEGRLGLGVTLAAIGSRAVGAREQRRLLLQSIAQLAAVRVEDPAGEAALYDRIVLLERVGRHEDAAKFSEVLSRRSATSMK